MIEPGIQEKRIAAEISSALPKGTFTEAECAYLAHKLLFIVEDHITLKEIEDSIALKEIERDLQMARNIQQVNKLLEVPSELPISEFEEKRRISLEALHATEIAADKLQRAEADLIAKRAAEVQTASLEAKTEKRSNTIRARAATAALAALKSGHPVGRNMYAIIDRINFLEEENERLKSSVLSDGISLAQRSNDLTRARIASDDLSQENDRLKSALLQRTPAVQTVPDTDSTLLWVLRRAGDDWGALGVAIVAARLSDPQAVVAHLFHAGLVKGRLIAAAKSETIADSNQEEAP